MTTKNKAVPNNIPLSARLSLAHWFARSLNFNNGGDMLNKMANAGDGLVSGDMLSEAMSYFLASEQGQGLDKKMFEALDKNIQKDLEKINISRVNKGESEIRLKYFQYMAVLAAEYTLSRLAASPQELAASINSCLNANAQMPRVETEHLNKLAFWMATGSGKTLIMHMNMLQFERYKANILTGGMVNNQILITPNDTMTEQHIRELEYSGIPTWRFSVNESVKPGVIVMSIHKLSDAVIQSLVGVAPNVIFVDEGHKGASSDKGYFDRRDRLMGKGNSMPGFAFEYSATFGQAVAVSSLKKRAEEYGRSILFDYSYGHFHSDGYGKDFMVMDIGSDAGEKADLLMFRNLLMFFQQRIAWEKFPDVMREYQIEKPLLLMLGAQVTGGKKSDMSESDTDIMQLVQFLKRACSAAQRNKSWVQKLTTDIVEGKKGFPDRREGREFAAQLRILREHFNKGGSCDYEELCSKMRELLFGDATGGDMLLLPIYSGRGPDSSDEIALRIGDAAPFGVVYVGESRKLCRMAKGKGISVLTDSLRSRLFPSIDKKESSINILVGARKFMEGWSSWRVCGMGLLHVGKSEGPQIIQLFGRGVRLQGAGWSLKRRRYILKKQGIPLTEEQKDAVDILENLNIFSVKAQFLSQFKKYLEQSGAIVDRILLPIFPHFEKRNVGEFRYPYAADEHGNVQAESITLTEKKIQAVVDLTVKLSVTYGVDGTAQSASNNAPVPLSLLSEHIDFNRIYFQLLRHRKYEGWFNIAMDSDDLPNVAKRCFFLHDDLSGEGCKEAALLKFPPGRYLQDLAFHVFRIYVGKLQGLARRRWEARNMKITKLGGDWFSGERHGNFVDYSVAVSASEGDPNKLKHAVEEWCKAVRSGCEISVKTALKQLDDYRAEVGCHLFQPLMLSSAADLSPMGLNKGEEEFVELLHKHVCNDKRKVFILRNLPKRGAGIALTDGGNFYPDFLIWVLSSDAKGKKERLIFADPKGLMHFNGSDALKMEIGKHLCSLSNSEYFRKERFEMDSFIISTTPYNDIKDMPAWTKWDKGSLKKSNVIFMEDLQGEDASVWEHLLEFKRPS